jgi:hypothetical protein
MVVRYDRVALPKRRGESFEADPGVTVVRDASPSGVSLGWLDASITTIDTEVTRSYLEATDRPDD